ncbi:MAG: hypothetical protein Fur0041_17170 [Bacteroidia bacterium]
MMKYYASFIFALIFTAAVAQPKTTAPLTPDQKREKGDFAGALADYNTEIAKIDADAKRIVKLKADYEKMSEFDKMNQNQDEIKKSYTDWSKLYYGRAMSNIGLGKKAEAKPDLDMAIGLDNNFADAYYQRALVTTSKENRDPACMDIAKAVSLGHKDAKNAYDDNFCWNQANLHYKEANSKLTLRKYQEAVDEYTLAIQLSPDSGNYYSKRGQAYLAMGNKTKALEDFSKAIEISPKSSAAYHQMGVYYFGLDNFEKAFEYFSKALEFDKFNYDAYMMRAQCCERTNKMTSAIYDYTQAASIRPYDPEAYYRRALIEKDMKNNIDACKDFKKAASLGHADAGEYAAECK